MKTLNEVTKPSTKEEPPAVEASNVSDLIKLARENISKPKKAVITLENEILRLDQRYLPDELYTRVPRQGITVVRSPKGTGKTELLKKLTKESEQRDESIMLLGHRVYLLRNLATRTNLDYYRDLDDGQTTNSMALCMNSLTRINQKTDKPYHTLIIDESEQVFQNLISKTLHSDLAIIFNNLIWLFQNATRIICLDADLSSELTLELVSELRGYKESDEYFGVINDYRIGSGQTTKMYLSQMHLLSDALEAIHAGDKVFIACNSRKFATSIDAIVKDMGRSSLLITAETNEQEDTQDFIENPTEECTRYDVVVSSPTLSTGVSIDGNHFTKIFGFFGINPGTFEDADQAISRVRNCSDVSVWVQGHNKEQTPPSEEAIYDRIISKEKGSLKRLTHEEETLTQGQIMWARIYARISCEIAIRSHNKDEKFARMREGLGFTMEVIPADKIAEILGKNIFSQFKDMSVDRAAAIFEARELALDENGNDEGIRLGQKKHRTHQEQLELERYRLHRELVASNIEFSIENVRRALQEELLQSIGRLRLLHSQTDEQREAADKADRKKNKSAFTANKHRAMQKTLLDFLSESAKVNVDELLEQAQRGNEVEISKDILKEVALAYESRKKDFNFYFDARVKDPTGEKNLKKVWDNLFGEHLSLYLIKKKRGPRNNREFHYYIDVEKKNLVHRVLEQDESLRAKILSKR